MIETLFVKTWDVCKRMTEKEKIWDFNLEKLNKSVTLENDQFWGISQEEFDKRISTDECRV